MKTSSQRATETSEPTEVERPRTLDTALEPFKVGDPLPVRMSALDMRRAFPVNSRVMGRSTFHRLERRGKFRRFELPGQPIAGKAWSGTRVARYLTNDSFAIEVKRSA